MTSFVKNIIVTIFFIASFSLQAATLEIVDGSSYINLESPDHNTVLIIDSEDRMLQNTLAASGWKVVSRKEVEKRTDDYLQCMDLTAYDSLMAKSLLRDISCQISTDPTSNKLKYWYKKNFGKLQADQKGVNINAVPSAIEEMRKEL
jgi:hypothetical protein